MKQLARLGPHQLHSPQKELASMDELIVSQGITPCNNAELDTDVEIPDWMLDDLADIHDYLIELDLEAEMSEAV